MGHKRYAVQCIVNGEENRQNCPFSLGFRHPARGGLSHGRRQKAQKLVKNVCVVPEISLWTDKRTDVLITILCNRSRGRCHYDERQIQTAAFETGNC